MEKAETSLHKEIAEQPQRQALLAFGRQPALDFMEDGEGKPMGIDSHIGRREGAAIDGSRPLHQWRARIIL